MQKVSNEQYQPDKGGIKSARDTPQSIPLGKKRSTENRGSNGTGASVTSATLECVAEKRVLYLTTIGRRTGLPREIEIWFVVRYERFYLFAETGEAAGWVKNIRRNPKVTVRIGEWRIDATASVLDRHSQVSSLLLFAASACTYRPTMARPVPVMMC